MKAIIPLSKEQRQQVELLVKERVREEIEGYSILSAYRTLGRMCSALSKYEGDPWGRKRLARLIFGTGEEAALMDRYEGIEDWKTCQEMRCIGLPELADALEAQSKKMGEWSRDRR